MGSPGERNVSVGIMSQRLWQASPLFSTVSGAAGKRREGQFSPQRQLAGALF